MKKIFITIIPLALLIFTTGAQSKVFEVNTLSGGTLTTNLVAYYKLEDATDFWASYNLTDNGGVVYDAGQVNNCADLGNPNTTKWLSTTNDMGIGAGSMSFAFWIYTYNVADVQFLVYHGGGNIAEYVRYQASELWGERSTSRSPSNGEQRTHSGFMLTNSTWYHVAFTFDSASATQILYVNGTPYTYTTNENPGNSGPFPSGFAIGYSLDYLVASPYKFDEVGIWSKALSQQEVTDLYNGTIGQTMVYSSPPPPATIDWNNSNVQELTLSENRSLALVNGNSGGVYELIIKQDGSGGRAIIWPSNVKWAGGNIPSFTSAANATDLVKFTYDGSNYLAGTVTLDIK